MPAIRQAAAVVFFRADAEAGRITEVTGQPEALLGFPREHWLERGFLADRVLPADQSALARMGSFEPGVMELRLVRADGSVVWVERTLARDDSDPNTRLGVLVDIDARILREIGVGRTVATMRDALLATAQKLAHPVNAISDFGSLLERHLATQGDEVAGDYALGIREGVERLRELAERLLAASRQAGGR